MYTPHIKGSRKVPLLTKIRALHSMHFLENSRYFYVCLLFYLLESCTVPVIVKLFKEPRHRFPARRAGTTTLFVVPSRQATSAGGFDSFGIDFWAPSTLKNTGSVTFAQEDKDVSKISSLYSQPFLVLVLFSCSFF